MISEALPMISVSLRIAPTLPSIIGSRRKRALERREDRFQLFCLLLEQKKKQRKNERTNQQSLLRTINHAHGLYFVSASIATKTFRSNFVVFRPDSRRKCSASPVFSLKFPSLRVETSGREMSRQRSRRKAKETMPLLRARE